MAKKEMTEKEKLKTLLEIGKTTINIAQIIIKAKKQAIGLLHGEISKLEEGLRKETIVKNNVEKLLLLEEPFEESLIKTREQLVALIVEQKREDITVGRFKALGLEIKSLKEDLAKMNCDHRLVIGHYGYSGSSSCDFDDSYSGYRQCIICGGGEYGDITCCGREETYKIFNRNEKRIIELIGRKDFFKFDLWRPLSEIGEWFKEKYKI